MPTDEKQFFLIPVSSTAEIQELRQAVAKLQKTVQRIGNKTQEYP